MDRNRYLCWNILCDCQCCFTEIETQGTFHFAFQINVMSAKRFNPFGKFDFQILMILFLPFASLNTQFIFSKHVESVISLWKYFVPIPKPFQQKLVFTVLSTMLETFVFSYASLSKSIM